MKNQTPTINIFDAIVSPNIFLAIWFEGIKFIFSFPNSWIRLSLIFSDGKEKLISLVNSPVITSSELIIALVEDLFNVNNTSLSLETSKSHPNNKFVSL